ncbi:MAG: hypothetical protein HQK53_18820, partial [Oligoflexia bacterium]|nr:hypothetical protein [Oligoflexia bacterium]
MQPKKNTQVLKNRFDLITILLMGFVSLVIAIAIAYTIIVRNVFEKQLNRINALREIQSTLQLYEKTYPNALNMVAVDENPDQIRSFLSKYLPRPDKIKAHKIFLDSFNTQLFEDFKKIEKLSSVLNKRFLRQSQLSQVELPSGNASAAASAAASTAAAPTTAPAASTLTSTSTGADGTTSTMTVSAIATEISIQYNKQFVPLLFDFNKKIESEFLQQRSINSDEWIEFLFNGGSLSLVIVLSFITLFFLAATILDVKRRVVQAIEQIHVNIEKINKKDLSKSEAYSHEVSLSECIEIDTVNEGINLLNNQYNDTFNRIKEILKNF